MDDERPCRACPRMKCPQPSSPSIEDEELGSSDERLSQDTASLLEQEVGVTFSRRKSLIFLLTCFFLVRRLKRAVPSNIGLSLAMSESDSTFWILVLRNGFVLPTSF